MIDLDKLDKLEAQATPGEWTRCSHEANTGNYCDCGNVNKGDEWLFDAYTPKDAAFVVALRNAYPDMAAELRRLRIIEKE